MSVMLRNLLRLMHSLVIGYICAQIASGYDIGVIVVGVEIGLTLLRGLFEHGLFSRNMRLQLLGSLVLGYTLFPNRARFVSWVFFLKGIEAHKALKNLRNQSSILNNLSISKYLAFAFDVARFSLSQFIFFGFVCSVYKFFLDCRSDPIPDPHVIVYQLVVTASTIGTTLFIQATATSPPNPDHR